MKTTLLDRHGQILLIALLLATALSLRLFGQDWDQGTYQHPDERFIAIVSATRVSMPSISNVTDLLNPASSPINPRRDDESGDPLSFAYGTLPIYVQGITGALLNIVSERDWNSYQELYRVGRTLTAIADTLTVLFIFLIGRRLFNPAAGFLAATFYTFTVLAIQLAHFFAVDTWLTLFVTATLFMTIRFVDAPGLVRSLALGAVIGMAFATKASVPSLLVPVFAGYAWVFWKSSQRQAVLGFAAAGGLLSLAVFTFFEPYALIRSGPFIEDIRTQARIVRGQTDIPFTRQFVGLTPGVYELRNMFAFTMGPGFLLAGLAGIVFGVRRLLARREIALAIPLLFLLAYIPTTMTTEARFLRYSLPIMPVLAVLAGGLLAWLIAHARYRRAGQVITATALALTVLWAAGFMNVYMQEHPRISASKWIHQNVPAGSVLSAEAWDDPLPVRYPGAPQVAYEIETLDIYGDLAPEQKVQYLFEALEPVDYVVLSSNRLVYSVDNLPWRYAVQNEFYRRLGEGQLGFQLVYEGLVQPEFLGIALDDRGADESFTVYDHPHVRIYQRVENLTFAEFRERFLWAIHQPWEPSRYPAQQRLLLDTSVADIETTDADKGWNSLATRNGLAATLFWLVALEVIGLSVLPLVSRVMRRAPDRGALSSRLIGILIIGWIVWFGASIGLWPATPLVVLLVTLAVAVACWLPLVVFGSVDRRTRLPTARQYAVGLGAFLVGFAVLLLFRAVYPDFWQTYYGGEKPFELAYLRAVTASTEFPPYDPWYADGFINYYYYGWHLFASVIKLSGVGVTMGFQLAVATTGALLVSQCLAIAGVLVRRRRFWPVAGALTVFFVVVAGNINGMRQVVTHKLQVTDLFDFWQSTRVIDYTINEFPYFSLVWADLHPHVMNLPHYVLLLALLGLLVTRAGAAGSESRQSAGFPFLNSLLIALVLGTVTVTNAWDAPLAMGLTAGAFLYTGARAGGLYWLIGAGYGILTVAVSFVLFAPFHTRFYSVVDGVERASAGSGVGQFLEHWGVFFAVLLVLGVAATLRKRRTELDMSLSMLVTAMVLGTSSIAFLISTVTGGDTSVVRFLLVTGLAGLIVGIGSATIPLRAIHAGVLAAIVVLAGASAALSASRPAASIAGAVAVVALLHALRHWRIARRFAPWALIASAAITIAAVEILYVADDLRNSPWERMNTVFKFYMQAWLLLGIGISILIAHALTRPEHARGSRRIASYILIGFLGLAVVVGSIYPLLGTPARFDQNMNGSPSGLTLDGYSWMEESWIHNGTGDVISFDDDLRAIEWLSENVDGTPIILEASIGPYRGNGSRISSATGLPTVLGWDRHQRQQRYELGISQRMRDVKAIYNETDEDLKLEMLRRYNVRFVIVGDVERYWNTPDEPDVYASPEGLEAFENLLGRGLEVVFTSGDTLIYEVQDFPRLQAVTR